MSKFPLISCLFLAVLAGGAAAEVKLTPFRVEETRSVALEPDTVGRMGDSLKLTLSLAGPEADEAVKYGRLKLTDAVDDKGTNLIPKKDMFDDAAELKEYSNQFFRKFDLENKRPAAAPQVEMRLGSAARAATKIARLKGEFVLVTAGELKTIELKGQSAAGSLKMEIPKEAGLALTLTVMDTAKGSELGVAMSGDESALESLEVLDAKGEKVSSGISTVTIGEVASKSLDMSKHLDETMKVVAKVSVGRKVTKVPFELKDIALP